MARSLLCAVCFALALAWARAAAAEEPALPAPAPEGPRDRSAADSEPGSSAPESRERRRPASGQKSERGRTSDSSQPSGRAVEARGSARERIKERPEPAKRPRKKTAYDVLKESWHAPASEDMCRQVRSAPVPDLVFLVQGKDTSYVLRPNNRQGGFDETQLELAKEAFGSWDGGPVPHARVLNLIYAATLHFAVPYVHLISGVRRDRTGSRHSHGLAADIVLPGIDDDELAEFFRAQGFVGVGTYPRSGFVHVDTRDTSYFWIDYSSPGRKGKITQVRADEAKQVDEAALVRGASFVNPPRLQKALNARAIRRRRVRGQRETSQASSVVSGEQSGAEQ